MSEESFRGFIAIPSPASLLSRLKELQQELRRLELDAKWVVPEQIHLTLKFLGQTPMAIKSDLQSSLEKIASDHPSFSFWVDRFGLFPNARLPRILWVGAGESPPEFQQLVPSLEEACVRFGFQKEDRPFKAHLTVGRLRSPKHAERLEKWIKEHPISWREEFPCERVILFQSTLTPKGPIYTPLYEVSLRKI